MTTQDSTRPPFSAQQAEAMLKNFHAEVTRLCLAQTHDAILGQREVLGTMLDQVAPAIEALKRAAMSAPIQVSTVLDSTDAAQNLHTAKTLQNQGSFDTFEKKLGEVAQHAQQQGQCPVTAMVYRVFYPQTPVPAVSEPSDTEVCRARMIRLAQYMVHQYAPDYLRRSNLPGEVAYLGKVPHLTQRDDLPEAIATLRELREQARHRYSCGYPSSTHEAALAAVGSLYGSMCATLAELDGFIVKPGAVMPRMLWVLRLGGQDKAAIDQALLGS